MPKTPGELYLALAEGDAVPCGRCGREVDLTKTCYLKRGRDGRVTVLQCHVCLEDTLAVTVNDLMYELVSAVGAKQAVRHIDNLLTTSGVRSTKG